MDINELTAYLFTPVVQIALIIGIAEVVKKLGLNSKYIPLVDLGLGLIAGLFIYTANFGHTAIEGVVIGIALGLSACGTFSGIKNLTQN